MKKLEAIIRLEKYEKVKEALNEIGVNFFTFWDVRGCGLAKNSQMYRGVIYDTSHIERRMISIVVNDAFVNKTIGCILASASTGEIGDGKIFITEVADTVRIRNSERGPAAVYLQNENAGEEPSCGIEARFNLP
jgi:nitrogen regulatory protein P-II 1